MQRWSKPTCTTTCTQASHAAAAGCRCAQLGQTLIGLQPMRVSRWASAVRALGAATVTSGVHGTRAAAGCGVGTSVAGVGLRGLAGEAAKATAAAAKPSTRGPVVRHASTGGKPFARRPAREGPVTALLNARTFRAAEAVLSAEGLNSRQVRACARYRFAVRSEAPESDEPWRPPCERERKRAGH